MTTRPRTSNDQSQTATSPAMTPGAGQSEPERQLLQEIRWLKLPTPELEFRFLSSRRFRFDMAWPDLLLAVEVEGGSWVSGRHTRGAGFEADCWKYNVALVNGWRVLRVTPKQITSGEAIAWLEKLLLPF